MVKIPLKCHCGAVEGWSEYSGKAEIRRYICMCGDCQTFPQFLGNPEVVLDQNGGTEIIPTFHWRIHFTSGLEQLRSVRLSDDGMLRWYTACCRTPVGNSLSDKMPYLGLIATMVRITDRERELGPVTERLMGQHGVGPLPPNTRDTKSLGFVIYVLRFIIKGKLRRKGASSSFFSPDGMPVATPLVLPDEEYIRLRSKTANPWRTSK